MSNQELLDFIYKIAEKYARKGPGWAQQSTVLREVASQFNDSTGNDLVQQRILTCWHDLFRQGRLSWGYNIDNPDAPFFHIPQPDPERDQLELSDSNPRAGTKSDRR